MADSPFKTFVYDYRYEGELWSFEIKARDRTEADERIHCLSVYGQFRGELGHKIIAPRGFTWLAYLIIWFRNWLERRKEAKKK